VDETVRVAAVQMDVAWLDPEANAETIRSSIAHAAGELGAKIVVFPELATSGYLVGRDREFQHRFHAAARAVPSAFTDGIAEATREHGCYAVVGMLRAHPTIPACLYNSTLVLGPEGDIVAVYDKTHIPSEEKHYFMAGSEIDVIRTKVATLGVLICADNSFPEAARVLALRGAEIICVSYSRYSFDEGLYLSLARARAYENQVAVVCANRVGEERWPGHEGMRFEGRSCIFGPDGSLLARSDDDRPCVITADLTRRAMEEVRLWQTRFRDRRPDLYGRLADGE
jgi:predicted amidohydrolase